jgi:hypothetical protein
MDYLLFYMLKSSVEICVICGKMKKELKCYV